MADKLSESPAGLWMFADEWGEDWGTETDTKSDVKVKQPTKTSSPTLAS